MPPADRWPTRNRSAGPSSTSARPARSRSKGAGFAIVEVISNCPVGWGMTPQESIERLRDVVAAHYPPGVIVDRTKAVEPKEG